MDTMIDFETMSCEEFHKHLNSFTDGNAGLNFLKDAKDYNYDFAKENEPEEIIRLFYNKNIVAADLIRTFIKNFGKTVLCRTYSYTQKKYMTIVDTLIEDMQNAIERDDLTTASFICPIISEAIAQQLRPATKWRKTYLYKLMTLVYKDFKEETFTEEEKEILEEGEEPPIIPFTLKIGKHDNWYSDSDDEPVEKKEEEEYIQWIEY